MKHYYRFFLVWASKCIFLKPTDIDYYFIYGPTIEDVVKKIAQLTGKTVFAPRWSLGYLASGMKYSEVCPISYYYLMCWFSLVGTRCTSPTWCIFTKLCKIWSPLWRLPPEFWVWKPLLFLLLWWIQCAFDNVQF